MASGQVSSDGRTAADKTCRFVIFRAFGTENVRLRRTQPPCKVLVNYNICFNIRYGRGAHCASACISPNYCLSH